MSLMGLDVGTTGCKAIVFDPDGAVLGQAYREYPLHHPQPGWAELDSNAVWASVQEAIAEATGEAGSGDPVKALAVSCQGEAATPIARDGKVLANTPVSFDARTLPQMEWWEGEMGAERLFQITGQPLHPMYTVCKVMWVRENAPEVYEQAWKFLCYEDLVGYRLGAEPAIDYSLAARTMAFDIRKEAWSEEILSRAGIEAGKLARTAPSGTVVGEVSPDKAEALGLPRGVKIVTGGHDQPCGALGAGIVQPNIAMDATGTVECITPAFSQPVLSEAMLRNKYPCYHHVAKGMYITLAYNFTGGSLLRWYRDVLGKQERDEAEVAGMDPYEILIGKARHGPSSVFVLPHFTTSGTPWMDAHAKGAILGLTLTTDKADLIKGMLDGITYEMRLNLDCLEESGVKIRSLRAIGGGAKSAVWLRLKANIFNRPVSSLSVSEAACLGAALLAGVAVGEYGSLEEAVGRAIRVQETYEPDRAEAAAYEERYQLYREIYPAFRDFLHRI